MDYIAPFRERDKLLSLTNDICRRATRKWQVMEVCGGQTHSIMQYGIDELLREHVEFLHGPGCPVCVTSLEIIETAQRIAQLDNVILCTFGDMLRVPGNDKSLLDLKARGAQIKIIYSPLDVLEIAKKHPDKEVVLLAIGFETTAPANAMAIKQADRLGIDNFSAIVSHMLTPPIVAAILQSRESNVQGFLAPGHVCTVTGYREYDAIADIYQVPIVVTGFEPLDLLQGVARLLDQLEAGTSYVENQYQRVTDINGNPKSKALLNDVFEICDQTWRGIGIIPKSGFRLGYDYQKFDALKKFTLDQIDVCEPKVCISGQVLKGVKKPDECPAFGTQCTPSHPLGAPMVSSEGACAAYHQYKLSEA